MNYDGAYSTMPRNGGFVDRRTLWSYIAREWTRGGGDEGGMANSTRVGEKSGRPGRRL